MGWYSKAVAVGAIASVEEQFACIRTVLGDAVAMVVVGGRAFVRLPHPMYLLRFPGFVPCGEPHWQGMEGRALPQPPCLEPTR